jgi:multiple sugar transport system substrate-binding protein
MVKWVMMLMSTVLLISGCNSLNKVTETTGSVQNNNAPSRDVKEPVTIKVHTFASMVDVFKQYVEPGLKIKYPNISLEYYNSETTKLQDMVTAGTYPDLYGSNAFEDIQALNLHYDMNELIKKYKMDLNSINKGLIDSVKGYGRNGEVFALPSGRNAGTLIYNKDIFDKFGVPYPKDGITWSQLLELNKTLTRNVDGIQYYGLHPNRANYLSSQLQLSYFDKNGKANVTTPDWQKVASTWKAIHSGYTQPIGKILDVFEKSRTAAMILRNPSLFTRDNLKLGLNWGQTTFPVFENGMGPTELGAVIGITRTSANKDAAFLVMEYFYSMEAEILRSKDTGQIPVSTSETVQQQFGSARPDLKDKNLAAIFKNKPAQVIYEEYGYIGESVIQEALDNMVKTNKDINTTLREAQE